MATRVIGKSAYVYFSDSGRTLDDRGIWVSGYAAGVALFDVIQPVERALYERMGLDLDRYYIMIYTDNPLLVIERGTSGDQIEFNGARYQLQSNNDWNPQDGWRGVLAIRLSDVVTP